MRQQRLLDLGGRDTAAQDISLSRPQEQVTVAQLCGPGAEPVAEERLNPRVGCSRIQA
jgi:hypothetical protein